MAVPFHTNVWRVIKFSPTCMDALRTTRQSQSWEYFAVGHLTRWFVTEAAVDAQWADDVDDTSQWLLQRQSVSLHATVSSQPCRAYVAYIGRITFVPRLYQALEVILQCDFNCVQSTTFSTRVCPRGDCRAHCGNRCAIVNWRRLSGRRNEMLHCRLGNLRSTAYNGHYVTVAIA